MLIGMVVMLLALLAEPAQAGVAVGVLAGVEVPLPGAVQGHATDNTRSETGPVGGLFLGWRFELDAIHIQPEASARLNPWSYATLLGAGLSVTTPTDLAVGGYAHIGLPTYEGPAWDAGAILELGTLEIFRPALRLGYVRSQAPHAKCGTCAQPAHHLVSASLALAAVF
jgi:hypothetical protein